MPSSSSNVLGKIVLNTQGDILKSGGELQNDQHTANIITNLLNTLKQINTCTRYPQEEEEEAPKEEKIERLSLHYSDHSYVVTLSGNQIQISRLKRDAPTENYLMQEE